MTHFVTVQAKNRVFWGLFYKNHHFRGSDSFPPPLLGICEVLTKIFLRPKSPNKLDHLQVITMSDYEEEPQMKIGDLKSFSRKVYTVVKVISKGESREVTSRNDNSTHEVCEVLIADDSGSVYLTLWDEKIHEINEDMIIKLDNAYVNVFRGSMRLNLGKYGDYSILEEAPFDEVDLENNVSAQQVEYDQRRPYGRGGQDRGRRRY